MATDKIQTLESNNQSHTTTWKDNIGSLNRISIYEYEKDVDNVDYVSEEQGNNIKKKLNGLSQYTSILNLQETLQDKNNPNKLCLMHINLNSIKCDGHFDAFVANLCLFERLPDIIFITESRLKNEDDLERFKLPNYHLYVRNRNGRGDGGVAMYVNNTFKVLERNDLAYFKDQVYESLFLEIRTQNPNFCLVCGVVYRTNLKHEKTQQKEKQVNTPPIEKPKASKQQAKTTHSKKTEEKKQTENQTGTTQAQTPQKTTQSKTKKEATQTNTSKQTPQNEAHNEFLEQLKKTVEILTKNCTRACICGDVNYDLMHQGEKEKYKNELKQYKEVMYSNNFFPCIYRPTRIAGKKATTNQTVESTTMQSENVIPYRISRKSIDHIWCNNLELVSNSAILVDAFWSDHLAVCCSLRTDRSHFTKKYELTKSNLKKLSDALLRHDWKEIEEDAQDAADDLKETVIKKFKEMYKDKVKSKISKYLQQENAKPDVLEAAKSESLDAVTKNFEDEFSKAVKNLTWGYKKKSGEELFKKFVKVLEKAITDLENVSFSSSWIELKDLSLDDLKEKHQTALNVFTDFLVNVSQNTKDAWDKFKKDHEQLIKHIAAKVQTNTKAMAKTLAENTISSIAVADVIGPALDPFQLTLSYVHFFNDANDKNSECAIRYLTESCMRSTYLFAKAIFPLNILFLLPDHQVRNKMFQLLLKICIRVLENIQAEEIVSALHSASRS